MASLSIAIAAHPKRKELAYNLLEKLPTCSVIVWDEHDDEWDTHQRAWRAVLNKAGTTHGLVLQDDAVLPRNLVLSVETGLECIPRIAVSSLYFGKAQNHPKIKRAVERAQADDASWLVASGTWWGVGIIIPTLLIPGMLSFCSKRREVYDRRLSIWCEHGLGGPYPCYYPWPSLIDHLDVESLIIPGRRPGRKAYRFIGDDADACTWDPTKGAVPCGRVRGEYIKLGGTRKGG